MEGDIVDAPDPSVLTDPPNRRPGATYLLLSLGAALTLLTCSPELLVAFGLMAEGQLQVMGTLAGLLLGIPTFILLLVTFGFSIVALFCGPTRLKAHVVIWWFLSVGSFVASIVTTKKPGYNYILGTPHPGLGVSDVILAAGLILGVALPLLWWSNARRDRASLGE